MYVHCPLWLCSPWIQWSIYSRELPVSASCLRCYMSQNHTSNNFHVCVKLFTFHVITSQDKKKQHFNCFSQRGQQRRKGATYQVQWNHFTFTDFRKLLDSVLNNRLGEEIFQQNNGVAIALPNLLQSFLCTTGKLEHYPSVHTHQLYGWGT